MFRTGCDVVFAVVHENESREATKHYVCCGLGPLELRQRLCYNVKLSTALLRVSIKAIVQKKVSSLDIRLLC